MHNTQFNDELSREVALTASALGYVLVELSSERVRKRMHVHCVVHHPHGVNLDGLAALHQAIEPRLEVVLNDRDLHVEFSSPGIDRVFKSFHEFAVFAGKRVRVMKMDTTEWIEATIITATSDSVELRRTDGSAVHLTPDSVLKARLSE